MKICSIVDKAFNIEALLIFVNDSDGARIEEGIDGLNDYAVIWGHSLDKGNLLCCALFPQVTPEFYAGETF